MNNISSTHFARIQPIVGTCLASRRVAVFGIQHAMALVEYLAASGIAHWVWQADLHKTTQRLAVAQLQASIHTRHGGALGLNTLVCTQSNMPAQEVDLVLACGNEEELAAGLQLAHNQSVPVLLYCATKALVVFPGDIENTTAYRKAIRTKNQEPRTNASQSRRLFTTQIAMLYIEKQRFNYQTDIDWNRACAMPLIAGIARALLLRGTAFERHDLEQLWAAGMRRIQFDSINPLDVEWSARAKEPKNQEPNEIPHFQTPPARRDTILVAGLGSIGSVAATLLAPHTNRLVLADADTVAATNPARQQYTLADIGQAKAMALGNTLAATCPAIMALNEALLDEDRVDSIISQYGITAALIATGTQADYAIARALRERGIPHVVARCYPRARYWEAILVDGGRGPAFDDIRGHVRVGPIAPPTPEQVAAYSDSGALEAEPATLIESGWAAIWAARLTWQLATPVGLRERWLLALLASSQPCLIGGAYVEQTDQGAAYEIELPGQVRAWGRTSLV